MRSFFLCQNPLVVPFKGIVCGIYSANPPHFFALLRRLDAAGPADQVHAAGANLLFLYEKEFYVLTVRDNLDKAAPRRLRTALREAVEWYIQCMAKAKKELNGERVSFALLTDFNARLPGVQILCFKQTGHYVLSYAAGVLGFPAFGPLVAYMRDVLGATPAVFEDCKINHDRP